MAEASTLDLGSEPAAESSMPSMLFVAADHASELADRLDHAADAWRGDDGVPPMGQVPDSGGHRVAIVDVTPRRLELARKVVAQGRPWRGRNGVWFEPEGLLSSGGKLAFVFPGVEPVFEPRVDDVAAHFGLDAYTPGMNEGERAASDLERQSHGIIAVARLLHRALEELGVSPDLVAGHSLGEWSASIASGILSREQVESFIEQLRPGTIEVADVTYLALGCSAELARELIEGLGETVVSHDNCRQQSVVCGPADEIAVAALRCKARRVLAQELPFRSGFHSPLFAEHLPAFRSAFGGLPLQAPRLPNWTATTCRPFPDDPAEIRRLAERHLTEPVRFRELILAMHDDGARVFVQVGAGTLTAFVEDTLRDHEAVAVASNIPKRAGLDQLHHVAAALWVEGLVVDFDRLRRPIEGDNHAPPAPAPAKATSSIGERRTASRTRSAPGRDQPVKAGSPNAAAATVATGASDAQVWQRRFALDVEPAWADHALFRQPPNWSYAEDRFPLVPMTGILEVLMESATRLHPDLVPIAIEDVAVFRYLVVEPPSDLTLRAATVDSAADGTVQVKVQIERHARATVTMAPAHPPAPMVPPAALVNQRPSHIDARRLYLDRHMFHGPAYQGVEEFLAVADNGSRAMLRTPAAPGALLDNAGQVMGHWLSAHAVDGRLVLPTSIKRLEFFGPHPVPDTVADCTVITTRLDSEVLRADITLHVDGRLWCRITDWADRRFPIDALVFTALQWPEHEAMSIARDDYTVVAERWADSATRDLIMRRYLGRDERPHYERRNPLDQREFLLGRIAAKDAIRRWLWDRGHGPLFPAEIVVADDHAGRPIARGPYAEDLHISLAQVKGVGVAVVAEGERVGIDIEKIERRLHDFERVALTKHEQRLEPPSGFDRDTWLTTMWAVKEAAARVEGHGLRGRPQDYEITDRQGSIARIGDQLIAFELIDAAPTRDGDTWKEHVVAWTLGDH